MTLLMMIVTAMIIMIVDIDSYDGRDGDSYSDII
jgi:hypothetical protein